MTTSHHFPSSNFMDSFWAGYDSDKEAEACRGCAPTDKDTLRVMKFLAAMLAFRKKIKDVNQGNDLPEGLNEFFEATLNNAGSQNSLETLDNHHMALAKALQLEPPKAKKIKGSQKRGDSQDADQQLESKVQIQFLRWGKRHWI